jgi:deoxycytidylate deaminase
MDVEKKGADDPSTACHPTCKLLDGFELFGWNPDPKLSEDENYMDMVMLITRSSHCKQGSMACVLIQSEDDSSSKGINESIISVATNGPLFSENDSDVHAEIAALGGASRRGTKTENATAYITMPPCKRCFAALVVSGIRRIVTRLTPPKLIEEAAKRHNIEVVALGRIQEQTARVNTLIYGDPNGKKKRGPHDEQNYSQKRIKETPDGSENGK